MTFTQTYGNYLTGEEVDIYNKAIKNCDVYDMSLSWNINGTAGELTETLAVEHPAYNVITPNDPNNFLHCKKDGETFWRGIMVTQPYEGADGLEGSKALEFVGELSLLTDIPCPKFSATFDHADGHSAAWNFVNYLLTQANDWWSRWGHPWRITAGNIDDFNLSSIVTSCDGQEEDDTIYQVIYDYFVDSLSAKMWLSYAADGVYLNIKSATSDYFPLCNQPADLMVNVVDDNFKYSLDVADQYSCIEPLGADLKDTNYQGKLFTSYDKLATQPSDWDTNYSDYSTRVLFKPITSKPSDWNNNWSNYYAIKWTDTKPTDEWGAHSSVQIGSKWATYRKLNYDNWFTSAPTFLEQTGKENTLPDGAGAPLYYEATVSNPETSNNDVWGYKNNEGEQFTSVDGDSYTLLTSKPSDWADNSSSYYSTPNTSNASGAGYKITIPTVATKNGAMEDDVLTSNEYTWTTRSFIQPHSVDTEYVLINNDNYERLLGAKRYKQIRVRKNVKRGKIEYGVQRVDTWSEGVSPLYEKAYTKKTTYDPVHGVNIADSYETLEMEYKALGSKPKDWSSNYTNYYVKGSDRDPRLNPSYDSDEYYSVPEYSVITSTPSNWKKNYTNYAIWDAKGGQYETLSEWQLKTSKPDDWDKKNWDTIKEKYAVRVVNEYKTLKQVYKNKDKLPNWSNDRFYSKHAPTLKGKYVILKGRTETRLKGRYLLFRKYYPFTKNKFYKQVVPAYKENKYYAQVAPAFQLGKVYYSGDEHSPDFSLEPVYSTNTAEDEKLNIRDEWMSEAQFAKTDAAKIYGYTKVDKVICNTDAIQQFGARVKRVCYDDAKTFDELVTMAAKELQTLSQASMEFELSAIDLSRANSYQLPSGWAENLDWFCAGEKIHIIMPNFGIDTILLCTEMSDYDFNDPSSGVMKVGTTWSSRLTQMLKPQRILQPKQSTDNAPLSIIDKLE